MQKKKKVNLQLDLKQNLIIDLKYHVQDMYI